MSLAWHDLDLGFSTQLSVTIRHDRTVLLKRNNTIGITMHDAYRNLGFGQTQQMIDWVVLIDNPGKGIPIHSEIRQGWPEVSLHGPTSQVQNRINTREAPHPLWVSDRPA